MYLEGVDGASSSSSSSSASPSSAAAWKHTEQLFLIQRTQHTTDSATGESRYNKLSLFPSVIKGVKGFRYCFKEHEIN